ncbi:hypothetical protein Tco_0862635 [Tanacetum coccineum]
MRTSKYDESNASALADPTLRARNPVKEILLKLNLLDHIFQDNEHEGKDTRSQGGRRFKDKDLKISRVKAKDQDIKIKLRDIKSKIKIQDHKHTKGTSNEFPRTQGS